MSLLINYASSTFGLSPYVIKIIGEGGFILTAGFFIIPYFFPHLKQPVTSFYCIKIFVKFLVVFYISKQKKGVGMIIRI